MNVSVRDQITPVPAGRTLFDVLRSIGVESFEAQVSIDGSLPHVRAANGTAFSIAGPSAVGALQERLGAEQMRISALLLATDFSGPEADRHVEWAAQTLRTAAQIGVPVVRIDTLTAQRELPLEKVRDNFIGCVRRVLEQTPGTGVDVGMENHGPISNDARFLDDVLAAVPDSRLGLTLDTGNFYWWGHPISAVYRLIEKYAARTVHTHIKNVNYPPEIADKPRAIGHEYKVRCCPVFAGNLDLRRVIDTLRRAGYRRDLCIEDESLFKFPESERLDILRRDVEAVRACI